jgi:hypothetical protein
VARQHQLANVRGGRREQVPVDLTGDLFDVIFAEARPCSSPSFEYRSVSPGPETAARACAISSGLSAVAL